MKLKMKIFVDIDETVCNSDFKSKNMDYSLSCPNRKNIEVINKYYDEGHEITYWTARGAATGIDWRDLTEKQLLEWGAKHHHLLLNKPPYDFYIDDKSINTVDWEIRGRRLPNYKNRIKKDME